MDNNHCGISLHHSKPHMGTLHCSSCSLLCYSEGTTVISTGRMVYLLIQHEASSLQKVCSLHLHSILLLPLLLLPPPQN